MTKGFNNNTINSILKDIINDLFKHSFILYYIILLFNWHNSGALAP